MTAVDHALPNDNALCISHKEITFIIQFHPVGALTKGKVPPASFEIVIFHKI
jgi:hypothetical protein